MTKLIVSLTAGIVLAVAAAMIGGRAQAAVIAPDGLRMAADEVAVVDEVQFTYRGHRFCWYNTGWRGPGWYRCGFRWRRGLGWGGPVGWRGWHRPGHHRPGVRPPHRPGIRPPIGNVRPGHRPDGGGPSGGRPGGGRPGGGRTGGGGSGGNQAGSGGGAGGGGGGNPPGGTR